MPALNTKTAAKRLALGSLILALGLSLGYLWSNTQGYRINPTQSMPQGIWKMTPWTATLHRGQTVFACPSPTALSRQAKARGYLYYGNCPSGYAPLLKPVAAIAGDIVELSIKGIKVNGQWLAHSAPFLKDSQGRPLPVISAGRYTVQPGTVWLISTYYPKSFDSRYFGPVSIRQIQGLATPVWLWSSEGEPTQ